MRQHPGPNVQFLAHQVGWLIPRVAKVTVRIEIDLTL